MKLHVCVEPGCGTLTTSSRCGPHGEARAVAIAEHRAAREPWRYLYGLRVWKEAREAARRQAGYRCEDCGVGEELGVRALDVHHAIKLATLWRDAGGGHEFDQARFELLATQLGGLVVLCDPCHARRELQELAR